VKQARAEGLDIHCQFMPRPIGVLYGLDLSFNPFSLNPSFRAIAALPLADKVARLRDPELRKRLIAEQPEDPNPAFVTSLKSSKYLFVVPEPANYDFRLEDSLQAKAVALGLPLKEVIYDTLLEDDGHAILCSYTTTVDEYSEYVKELIGGQGTIVALGDGGAHYGMICDAAYTTYVLSARVGRNGLSLETAVKALTSQPAASVALGDRGIIEVGYKADLNVIDLERLSLHRPKVHFDLPAGGKRLMQEAEGYVATVVSGTITYREGQSTGALPGRLVRHARQAPPKQQAPLAA
jgi:N-acyl-D-aspartate/D-glutamate deacylase